MLIYNHNLLQRFVIGRDDCKELALDQYQKFNMHPISSKYRT